MKQRRLGKDGPQISAVGYGAMSFADFYGPATEDGSMRILDACMDLGITHIDTSNVYGDGRSETVLGKWLAQRGGEPPFTIATKGGITRDPDRRINNDPAHMSQALDASLKRLGVEAVDLYYVHRLDKTIPVEDTAGTMAGFVKAGKVKSIGFSEIAPTTLRRAAAVHPVAAVQSEYSLSTRLPEMGMVQTCAALGTSLVAFSPLGRALLTDRPHQAAAIDKMPFLRGNPRFREPNLGANIAATEPFRALAADMGVATATLAIAWVLSRGEHITAIPGTRHVDHLKEVAAGGALTLSPEDLARIDAILPIGWAHGDRYSRAQWDGPEMYC